MIAIGRRLREAGHEVVISLAEPYADVAADAGLDVEVVIGHQQFTEALGNPHVWKPIRGPVMQSPLGFCDAGSIDPRDMLPTDLIYADRTGEIYSFTWRDSHRWYYYSAMRADEALLLKCYDASEEVARFTAHSAFDDPTSAPDARVRESIEVRTLVFW